MQLGNAFFFTLTTWKESTSHNFQSFTHAHDNYSILLETKNSPWTILFYFSNIWALGMQPWLGKMMVYRLTTFSFSSQFPKTWLFECCFCKTLGNICCTHPPIIPPAGPHPSRVSVELGLPGVLTTSSGHQQVILTTRPRSRALMGPSEPGKTAWGLESESGNLAWAFFRMNGKRETYNLTSEQATWSNMLCSEHVAKACETLKMGWDNCTWIQHKSCFKNLFQTSVFLSWIHLIWFYGIW